MNPDSVDCQLDEFFDDYYDFLIDGDGGDDDGGYQKGGGWEDFLKRKNLNYPWSQSAAIPAQNHYNIR